MLGGKWRAVILLMGVGLLWSGSLEGKATYGQARSKQVQEDYAGAVEAYLELIEDLWDTKPDSILLPKSYVGCAYCALKLGDVDLALQS